MRQDARAWQAPAAWLASRRFSIGPGPGAAPGRAGDGERMDEAPVPDSGWPIRANGV